MARRTHAGQPALTVGNIGCSILSLFLLFAFARAFPILWYILVPGAIVFAYAAWRSRPAQAPAGQAGTATFQGAQGLHGPAVSTRLNLENDPDFAQAMARLEQLTEALDRGAWMAVIPDYHRVTSNLGVGTPRRLVAERIGSTHPSRSRYEFADPKYILFKQGDYELVAAPGVLVVSDAPTKPAYVAMWSALTHQNQEREVEMPEPEAPRGGEVVRTRWEHQKPDGGPDLRYPDNPKYATVRFYDLQLKKEQRSALRFRFLSADTRRAFTKVLGIHVPEEAQSARAPGPPPPGASGPRPAQSQQPRADRPREAKAGRSERSAAEARTDSERRARDAAERKAAEQAAAADRARRTQRPEPASPKSPWEVLGITSGASRSEIAAAYKKLVLQYHPDRVNSLGPEFRELAEERMREINAAYEHLKGG